MHEEWIPSFAPPADLRETFSCSVFSNFEHQKKRTFAQVIFHICLYYIARMGVVGVGVRVGVFTVTVGQVELPYKKAQDITFAGMGGL